MECNEGRSINAAKFKRKVIDETLPENITASAILDAAFRVHQELGPGLLEFVYEGALALELANRGLKVQRQVPVPVIYNGVVFDEGLRLDLLVSDLVVVELKSVEAISPAHAKVLLTYLRFSNKKLGLIINFSQASLKQGIRRVVNGL